ncbi:MAG TPA: phage major capsid protein [Vicinamibacterales bacterium]|nr:phage major capsid protein [Vicinamibacterales bacterium]
MADDPELELKNLGADLKKATDEVKAFAEKVTTEMKNLGAATEETKANADKALISMNELSARVTEIEQKAARRQTEGGPTEAKSIGQMVVENDGVKALMERKNGQARVTIELKNILTGTALYGTHNSVANALITPTRGDTVLVPTRPFFVRDLITPGTTSSNAIEYAVETSNPYATQAAVVSEGLKKPQSENIAFDLKSTPVRTIAHYMKASRQILDDVPMLASMIDGRLRFGLQYVEEQELLFGDGTGQHLFGIVPQATAYAAAFTPSLPTAIDTLRLAALQATLALYPATGYVLHPTDWAKIELTKDTQGRYIVGDPQAQLMKRLWTLPVVDTQTMQAGKFLTGAFKMGAQIFDRMSIEVLVSTENEDDFVRNMITVRAEERLAIAVYRPTAFIYGNVP